MRINRKTHIFQSGWLHTLDLFTQCQWRQTVFMLKPSACCVWQTTRHSYLKPWPVKETKQKTWMWLVSGSQDLFYTLNYLIQQLISLRVHCRKLPECLITHKADLMTILHHVEIWVSQAYFCKHSTFSLNNITQ